jgi:hypothetical protein
MKQFKLTLLQINLFSRMRECEIVFSKMKVTPTCTIYFIEKLNNGYEKAITKSLEQQRNLVSGFNILSPKHIED